MNLDAIKHRVIAPRHQLVVVDRAGRLVATCDSLIPLSHHLGETILPLMDIFAGMEAGILAMQPSDPRIHLPMMGFKFEERSYRLSMEIWVEEGTEGVLWLMSDDAMPSETLRRVQQDRNDTHIGMERIVEQEQELREYTARLEQAHQALQRFAFIVSHDLRAPLRAIGNLANWIDEAITHGDHADLPEFLRLLHNRVQRMEELIEGVLRYHRVGHQQRELETVDVRELILDLHATIFDDPTCRLILPAFLPEMYCSRAAIHHIFSNLFSNVHKYALAADCTIEIHYLDEGQQHKFGVSDNGPGIDPKHHQRIFEIFQTLQSKDEDESNGIGLSIVKRLVDDAGGKVWVESQLGHGATFWFTWPK